MKPFLFFLVLSVSLSSCAPKPQTVTGPQMTKLEKGETLIINTTLNLFTFPRSVIYQMEEDKNKTTYAFYTPILIDSVFDNYHYQLVGNGWTQERVRKWDKAYEALYSRQGQRLTVRLRLEADRYILRTS
jgi:hypothetical protein